MNEVKKTWYAVTNEKEDSYEWDNGSFSYDEAVKMLEEQGGKGNYHGTIQ